MRPLRLLVRRASSSLPGVISRNASASTKDSSELVTRTPVASPSAPSAQSSVAAGTTLKGLGFHQNRPDPIALPDAEYPEWLWRLLDAPSKRPSTEQGKGYQAEASIKGQRVMVNKKDLRKNNRESIRSSNFLKAQ
ncbi:MAG: hypothetical protein CYPHOPRED_002911 [Cyphobasidiales sp. Tagirdzhanova-0007]|nr:MAG: hypothetical protein CYPHOPRED_002911 [Cyphobasidiales sp. Tagirdzhanova-0007]